MAEELLIENTGAQEAAADTVAKKTKTAAAKAPAKGAKKEAPAKKAASSKKDGAKKGASAPDAEGGAGEGRSRLPEGYIPRLKKLYKEKYAAELKEELKLKSVMQIPRLKKIVVSMGVGKANENKKLLDAAVEELGIITGQKALKTKARKSIANFKIRAGQEIGARVTLRGAMMYEFLDRLVNAALPRVKDFRGISADAFDGHGNYALGIEEQIIFPEIDFDKIERVCGLNVVIVTSAATDAQALALLKKFNLPFKKHGG